jgi:hypothetical protein
MKNCRISKDEERKKELTEIFWNDDDEEIEKLKI